MKKILLVTLSVCIALYPSFTCSAQASSGIPVQEYASITPQEGTDSTAYYNEQIKKAMFRSGYEMRRFTQMMYSGTAFTVAGGALVAVGTMASKDVRSDKSKVNPMLAIGGGLMVVGTICYLVAPSFIERAGIILQGGGIGLPIKVGKSKYKKN